MGRMSRSYRTSREPGGSGPAAGSAGPRPTPAATAAAAEPVATIHIRSATVLGAIGGIRMSVPERPVPPRVCRPPDPTRDGDGLADGDDTKTSQEVPVMGGAAAESSENLPETAPGAVHKARLDSRQMDESSSRVEGSGPPDLAHTVYVHLRAVAQRQMEGEQPGNSLS